MANYLQSDKYPGEQFSLAIKMTDEMNQTASGFLQLNAINMNNQVSSSMTSMIVVSPAIVTVYIYIVSNQVQSSPCNCLSSLC